MGSEMCIRDRTSNDYSVANTEWIRTNVLLKNKLVWMGETTEAITVEAGKAISAIILIKTGPATTTSMIVPLLSINDLTFDYFEMNISGGVLSITPRGVTIKRVILQSV